MLRLTLLILAFIFIAGVAASGQIKELKVEKIINNSIALEIKKEVNAPPPLRAKVEAPRSFLTVTGVIDFTNRQRVENGLAPLSNNQALNTSALAKAQDMFDKQYFAHESPDGKGAGDLANDVGYEYITIGENLALGNFLNDEVLVRAWMDSPGHRANILNSKYSEIGVSVIRGTYEGKSTWISVQHFGKPLSTCPKIDGGLKQKIDGNESQLNIINSELETKKKEINAYEPKHGEEYNQKIEEYNSLVNQYNNLIEETKSLINQYNTQVNAFNACAS